MVAGRQRYTVVSAVSFWPPGARAGMIRLVTFDLDGTLWSLDGVIERAETKTREWLAQRAPKSAELPENERQAVQRAVFDANPHLRHDISRLRELALCEVLTTCGYAPEDAANLAAGAFAEFLAWRHRVEFFDGALDVVAELAGAYTLAALTNGNADYRRLELAQFFAFGYCAADVGASKPHRAMFERAIAHAGIAPNEAVHVGDSAVHDVAGATDAGMATIWVNLERSSEDVPATATVTSLDDLPATIASLNRR